MRGCVPIAAILVLSACSLDRSLIYSAAGPMDAAAVDSSAGDGGEGDDAPMPDAGPPNDAGCAPGTFDANHDTRDGCECTLDSPPTEVCDGRDNDCDQSTADGAGDPRLGMMCDGGDLDMCADGMFYCHGATLICSDDQASHEEICGNAADEDCDGAIDESTASNAMTFYYDTDHDGYGTPSMTVTGCTAPAGYVATGGDCDDSDPNVHPGAPETCNGRDDDCNGTRDDTACSPCNVVQRSGRPYLFCPTGTSWSSARDICAALTAYQLVEVDDSSENDFVHTTAATYASGGWWIGLRQSGSDWIWANLSRPGYTDWEPGQPDDGGTFGGPEDCVEINAFGDAGWNDNDCGATRRYVCEVIP